MQAINFLILTQQKTLKPHWSCVPCRVETRSRRTAPSPSPAPCPSSRWSGRCWSSRPCRVAPPPGAPAAAAGRKLAGDLEAAEVEARVTQDIYLNILTNFLMLLWPSISTYYGGISVDSLQKIFCKGNENLWRTFHMYLISPEDLRREILYITIRSPPPPPTVSDPNMEMASLRS